MRLWIDCEWNDFQGELISMALVDEDSREFYEVVGCESPMAWVFNNVMPVLDKDPVPFWLFRQRLGEFLSAYRNVHIIADWPEDIAHFCNALIRGAGERIDTPPLTLEVVRECYRSTRPHNALADACGLREGYLAEERRQQRIREFMRDA